MPAESDADRLAFLNLDEFAVLVQFTIASPASAPLVPGIFDTSYQDVNTGELVFGTREGMVTVREIDVPGLAESDTFQPEGKGVYTVIGSPQPDGEGMLRVMGHK